MSESADTGSPEAGSSRLPSAVSRDLIGIVLSVAAAYGSLVLPGRLSMVSAGVNGVGAILIVASDETTSTNTAGYFFALGSWSLLALSGLTTRVAIPTMLAAFWFALATEREILAEATDF